MNSHSLYWIMTDCTFVLYILLLMNGGLLANRLVKTNSLILTKTQLLFWFEQVPIQLMQTLSGVTRPILMPGPKWPTCPWILEIIWIVCRKLTGMQSMSILGGLAACPQKIFENLTFWGWISEHFKDITLYYGYS